MNKIKILQPEQAQKIAAGEVIERPSNVVKELIENSIDAHSTQISLFIENAGKKLIRVIDNGCGMSEEDAQLCFLPHATSKITTLDELECINSLGFRGEALASISAVSQVTLVTKLDQLKDSDVGVKVEFADSRIQSTKSISCNVGTDISIHNLFYNVPVRKKFLKQDETEWNQIQGIFQAFCLSHISIHFKLFRDEKMILNIPVANDLRTRITQLWGNNLTQNLLKLENNENSEHWLNFTGYISNHNFWKYGRTHIFFFVNGRWVKNPELSKGLTKGYLNVLPPDKSPVAFIFTTIDKTLVDINCHPKKEEVRFIKPHTIQTILQKLIKLTLEAKVSSQLYHENQAKNWQHLVPKFNFEIKKDQDKNCLIDTNSYESIFYCNESNNSVGSELENLNFINKSDNINSVIQYQEKLCPHDKQSAVISPQYNPDFVKNRDINGIHNNFKIIGQLFNTYIIIESGNELVMIDQHAAHERILYEKMLNNFEKKDGVRLLFPETLKLTESQINLLLEHKSFLSNQGIEIDLFGKNEMMIKSGPAGINNTSLNELILEIADFIEENEYLDIELFRKKLNEHMHSHLACKLAIKAGDFLSLAQMENVVQELQKTEKCFICVHGRPTTWTIKKLDLEKNFKRK